MLITFEGGEGAGKSTLISQVVAYLKELGQEFLEVREPGGTALGEEVRKLILHSHKNVKICPKAELLLYLTSRAQIVKELIDPALESGKIVLCDRFNDSTVAYQGGARGLGCSEVRRLCDFVCASTRPALTFYLDVDPVIGLERASKLSAKDRMESEALLFHQNVRRAFLEIAQQEPERVKVLDANKPQPFVYEDAMRVLRQCLPI